MLPNTDVLSTGLPKTLSQAVENTQSSTGRPHRQSNFAEIIDVPLQESPSVVANVIGKDLPPGGGELPPARDSVDGDSALLGLMPIEHVLPIVAETAAGSTQSRRTTLENSAPLKLDLASTAMATNDVVILANDAELPNETHPRLPGIDPIVLKSNVGDRTQAPAAAISSGAPGVSIEKPLRALNAFAVHELPERLQSQTIPGTPSTTPPGSIAEPSAKPIVQGVVGDVSVLIPEAIQAQPLLPTAKPMTVATATRIELPVSDNRWGSALQDRVMWMSGQNIQQAEIRLNPSELGPIRVTVSVQDDAAQLTFSAQHALTREAIEQAMPRLREMFSENGLSLASTTVTDSDSGEVNRDRQNQNRDSEQGNDLAADDSQEPGTAPARRITSSALVDTFA